MSARRVALVLSACGLDGESITALRLAERLLARGVRVTVFAHAEAAALAAGEGPLADAVAALLRRGVHGATLDWVVDSAPGPWVGAGQPPGVVRGDHADLWAFVREADLVLTPAGVA